MASANQELPTGLDESELRALVGLVRTMVGLDHRFDDDEAGSIGTIAQEVGEESFWTHMQSSYDQELDLEAVLALAKAVERKDAQEQIYGNLYELAINGGIEPAEAGLLKRLSQLWDLEIREVD